MTVGMYSVLNETTKIHGIPFTATTDEEAKRLFEKAYEEAKEKTDEKFKVVKIGKFDIITGMITGGEYSDI